MTPPPTRVAPRSRGSRAEPSSAEHGGRVLRGPAVVRPGAVRVRGVEFRSEPGLAYAGAAHFPMREALVVRDNRLNRQPSGRGRSSKRTPSAAPPAPAATGKPSASAVAPGRPPRRPPRNITARAIIAVVVVAGVAISFANSARVWYLQSGDLATAQAQIDERTARVAELQGELARWDDPAYVKAQARARLGWVMPGDTGYRVIGADGDVLSGSAEIEGVGQRSRNELEAQWWDRLASSIKHADAPLPGGR